MIAKKELTNTQFLKVVLNFMVDLDSIEIIIMIAD